ncbi:hypothetical protein ACIBO2_33155 [Nonomuraea sp. NPDC050022]|uniref:hypothetical protein n=1 Tax=unclassified Nonomuraea TaxID=2593643 RepID=UPI0033D36B8D
MLSMVEAETTPRVPHTFGDGLASPFPGGDPMRPASHPEPAGVAQIPGLRPRLRAGDGGEVPAADVDLVDALDPRTRRTVTAWLSEKPSAPLRQTRLRILASFLRWLHTAEPALDLLTATEAQLDAYCYTALTTGVRASGKPLTRATVIRRRATLASFYAFARRTGADRSHRGVTGTPPLTPAERRLLRTGARRLADDGRWAEALAVALLEATGACVEALAALTAHDVRPSAPADQLTLITLRDGRDGVVAFPVSPEVRHLLRALCASRPPGEPLIRRDDGRSVDLEWIGAALTDAALAAGVPRQRAELLHPRLLRARTVTELARP